MPWFNSNCVAAKQRVKRAYKELRRKGYPSDLRSIFVKARKDYRAIVKETKSKYIESIKTELREVKNSPAFWKTVARLRKKAPKIENSITGEQWEDHFRKLMGHKRTPEDIPFHDCRHPTLDARITLQECLQARKKLRNGKSPGLDGI
ncbi:unnamed protein product, partial [Allacma fusca]